MTRTNARRRVVAAALPLALLAATAPIAPPPVAAQVANVYVVTTGADVVDAAAGVLSLREAAALDRADGAASTIVVGVAGDVVVDRCDLGPADGAIELGSAGATTTLDGGGRTLTSECGGVLRAAGDLIALSLAVVAADTGPAAPAVAAGGSVRMAGSTVTNARGAGVSAGGPVDLDEVDVVGAAADGVTGSAVDLERVTVSGSGSHGVRTGGTLRLRTVTLADNGGTGAWADGETDATDVTATGNDVGLHLAGGGSLTESRVFESTAAGVVADGDITIGSVDVADGSVGVQVLGGTATVTTVELGGSLTGVHVLGGRLVLAGAFVDALDTAVRVAGGAVAEIHNSQLVGGDGDTGLAVEPAGTATAAFTTFADFATSVTNQGGTVGLQASVVDVCVGTIIDAGFNAQPAQRCGLAAGNTLRDIGAIRFDANLRPEVGSPLVDAIPAATCPALDRAGDPSFNGVTRPEGPGCDIGSVEVPRAVPFEHRRTVAEAETVTVDVLDRLVDPAGRIEPGTFRIVTRPEFGAVTTDGSRVSFTAGIGARTERVRWRACTSAQTECVEADLVVTVTVEAGYWALEENGTVHAFAGAPVADRVDVGAARAVAIAAHPDGRGFWVVLSDGGIVARGSAVEVDAIDLDGLADPPRKPGEVVTSIAANGDGSGVWVFTNKGRIIARGAATPPEQMLNGTTVIGLDLDGDIVDSFPTPTGRGVYMAGADGGVFAVGDATFVNSVRDFLPPGVFPDQPVVGIVADPDGEGYWMVAADGGVFAIGAPFVGSLPAIVPFDQLVAPINGMVAAGTGYFLVADDGGVFAFEAPFLGSASGRTTSRVSGLAVVG